MAPLSIFRTSSHWMNELIWVVIWMNQCQQSLKESVRAVIERKRISSHSMLMLMQWTLHATTVLCIAITAWQMCAVFGLTGHCMLSLMRWLLHLVLCTVTAAWHNVVFSICTVNKAWLFCFLLGCLWVQRLLLWRLAALTLLCFFFLLLSAWLRASGACRVA